jgi:hypothetical protein
MNMEYIVSDEKRTLPNGVRVQRSIYPKEQIGFNQWANQLGVSSSYQPKYEEPLAMKMMRECGVKGVKGLGFM